MTRDQRIALLRKQMQNFGIQALIVPTADPHLCEYPPEHWKLRQWFTGFTGSAGMLVVTLDAAALWTDSRYFLQAEQQLAGSAIELCRDGLPNTPTFYAWIEAALPIGAKVGFDGRLCSIAQAREHIEKLTDMGFAVDSACTIADDAWTEQRPPLPAQRVFVHAQAADIVGSKLAAIRARLHEQGAQACLLTALDEVAWAFNLRGADIAYNPVFVAYGYIDELRAVLFVAPEKMGDVERQHLVANGVELRSYADFVDAVPMLLEHRILAVDMDATNFHVYSHLQRAGVSIIERNPSAVATLKARKSVGELADIRQAMLQDGAAMCEFLCWLERNAGKVSMDEVSIAQRLLQCRQRRQYFVGESFAPIVAYGEHAAIVHYSATSETSIAIGSDSLLLIDSGGQYYTGTTDITRTMHLGQPTAEQRQRYTLVLRGMIDLSMAQFPQGTHGGHLDTIARQPLWSSGLNYGHGTGHGVGYFLNVHEGPQRVRAASQTPIEAGMVISNEPGVYIAGVYGIRIENLMVCCEAMANDFGRFLSFETLTLCPISTKLIEVDMLMPAERDWLNAYHAMVRERLLPLVDAEVGQWLVRSTAPI